MTVRRRRRELPQGRPRRAVALYNPGMTSSASGVQIELPEDVARLLDPSGTDVAGRAREAVVLHLFQQGSISAGRGAELLGMSKDAFRALHQRHGIPYFRQTPDELLEEIRAAYAARADDPT